MYMLNRLGQRIIVGNRRRHCRCRSCGARQVKAKHPAEYLRRIRCKSCGEFDTLRIDKWADRRGWRYQTCYCDGYHFPHRIRSEFCYHNPNYPAEDAQRAMVGGM
jgi:hypothetical protein|tara:strand:+ start:11603 stop:11917 length:315 start_codon:yes stop_codon:yes gene_type:complete